MPRTSRSWSQRVFIWQKVRDSNPCAGFPTIIFPGCALKPLMQPSIKPYWNTLSTSGVFSSRWLGMLRYRVRVSRSNAYSNQWWEYFNMAESRGVEPHPISENPVFKAGRRTNPAALLSKFLHTAIGTLTPDLLRMTAVASSSLLTFRLITPINSWHPPKDSNPD